MKLRLLIGAYAGLLVFFLLSAYFGENGHLEIQRLQKHYEILKANIEDLQELNQQYTGNIEALSTSEDAVAVKAHDLGYVGESEGIIQVLNYVKPAEAVSPGQIVKLKRTVRNYTPFIRATSISVALVVFLLLFIFRQKISPKNNLSFQKEGGRPKSFEEIKKKADTDNGFEIL